MTSSLPLRGCGLVSDKSVRVSVPDAESSDEGRRAGAGWSRAHTHRSIPSIRQCVRLFFPCDQDSTSQASFLPHSHSVFSSVLLQQFLSIESGIHCLHPVQAHSHKLLQVYEERAGECEGFWRPGRLWRLSVLSSFVIASASWSTSILGNFFLASRQNF